MDLYANFKMYQNKIDSKDIYLNFDLETNKKLFELYYNIKDVSYFSQFHPLNKIINNLKELYVSKNNLLKNGYSLISENGKYYSKIDNNLKNIIKELNNLKNYDLITEINIQNIDHVYYYNKKRDHKFILENHLGNEENIINSLYFSIDNFISKSISIMKIYPNTIDKYKKEMLEILKIAQVIIYNITVLDITLDDKERFNYYRFKNNFKIDKTLIINLLIKYKKTYKTTCYEILEKDKKVKLNKFEELSKNKLLKYSNINISKLFNKHIVKNTYLPKYYCFININNNLLSKYVQYVLCYYEINQDQPIVEIINNLKILYNYKNKILKNIKNGFVLINIDELFKNIIKKLNNCLNYNILMKISF